MNNPFVIGLIAALIGVGIGYAVRQILLIQAIGKEEQQAGQIVSAAREKAREIELEAKNKAIKTRETADEELDRRRQELNKEDD
ncbi:MAG: Rnase Y domain-containing protein, partial [Anaerolineales bacterium]